MTEILESAFAGREGWSEALQMVAGLAGARGAAILPVDPAKFERLCSTSLDEISRAYLPEKDFRRAVTGKILRNGIGVDQDIVSADQMARLPFYRDFLASHGFRWFAGLPFRDGQDAWILTLQRTPGEGAFDEDEQAVLRRLGCALSQGVSVARRVAAARVGGIAEGLEAAGLPALTLDRSGNLLDVLGTLDEDLRRDLGIAQGRPPLDRTMAGRHLRVGIDAALNPGLPDDHPDRRPVVVRREGRRPVALRVRALAGESARFFSAAVLVLVDDLGRPGNPPIPTLMEAFGLTRRQASVAALIGTGHTIRACADELGIGIEAVRTTLQKVFQKTEVTRQAELVRIVSRICG